ncbi:hypothetical protein [Tardiphaga sp. 839_C3_N1_4]|uniref:hypothetical protein n=1 Tax=Tardiphaga sp. 839_C3_N1_4 TaxID=3240761 RepID=UPI003F269D5A
MSDTIDWQRPIETMLGHSAELVSSDDMRFVKIQSGIFLYQEDGTPFESPYPSLRNVPAYNAFELFPDLAREIERMASTGTTGSLNDWQRFTDAVNNTIAELRDRVSDLHRRAQKAEGVLARGGRKEWLDLAMRYRDRARTAERRTPAPLPQKLGEAP